MRPLLLLMFATLVTRVVPLLVWPNRPCVRDECTYRDLSAAILRGDGMVGTRGWLWAPGYPGLIAGHTSIFHDIDAVKWTQVGAAVLAVVLMYRLAVQHFGPRAAFIAGLLFALNPTHIFYATTWLSEGIYTTLLLATVAGIGWARGGENPNSAGVEAGGGNAAGVKAASVDAAARWPRALVVGACLGACVLFRGIATYLLPCVAMGLLWGRWRSPAARKAVVATVTAATIVVAPYSVYASRKFDAVVISDRTLGQMMWLGNNDYPPITFDFGNGLIKDSVFEATILTGRPHCPHVEHPAQQDSCELANGVAWIKSNPGEFIARMPLRVSQMLTPHSLLTRTLRTGRWGGMPQWVDEAIVGSIVGLSFLTLVGGTLGIFARGKGWFTATSAAIVGYHIAAIACLAGLSRYRVPLEPLWMIYAGAFLANPRESIGLMRGEKMRWIGGILVTLALLMLMMRFLPAGWKGWKSW